MTGEFVRAIRISFLLDSLILEVPGRCEGSITVGDLIIGLGGCGSDKSDDIEICFLILLCDLLKGGDRFFANSSAILGTSFIFLVGGCSLFKEELELELGALDSGASITDSGTAFAAGASFASSLLVPLTSAIIDNSSIRNVSIRYQSE